MKGRFAIGVGLALTIGLVLAAGVQAAAPGWRVMAATGPTHLPPVTAEIQKITVDASGGSFALEFEGEETGSIPYDSDSGVVAAFLNGLASVSDDGGAVKVAGGPGNQGGQLPYYVTFEGGLAGQDVPTLIADSSGLTGGAQLASVSTVVSGSQAGSGELTINSVNVGGAATSGVITMTVGPLPQGITTSGPASGRDPDAAWECPAASGLSTVTCTYPDSLASLKDLEVLNVPLAVDGTQAAAQSAVPVTISGGGAALSSSYEAPIVVSLEPAEPGIQAFWAGAFDENGETETQAGDHPFAAITSFLRTTVVSRSGQIVPAGDLHEVRVDLPPGFIGNPLITNRCPQEILAANLDLPTVLCDSDSVIGTVSVFAKKFGESVSSIPEPIFNDEPAVGYPAQFSAIFVGVPLQSLFASVRSDDDFGVSVTAPSISTVLKLYGTTVALRGSPATAGSVPLLTNPTNCKEAEPVVSIAADTWSEQGVFSGTSDVQPAVTGCDQLDLDAEFSFQPGATDAATGTGAVAHLTVDQEGLLDKTKLAAAHLKKSVVTLPENVVLNPAAAGGLEACSTAQIGLIGVGFGEPNPIRFDTAPATCPDASKIGAAKVESPLLEDELAGTVYLASQDDNPFKSLLAMYLVVEDEKTGLVLKLPGKVTPNPTTGQLTAEFDNNPQVPFTDLTLSFRGGGPQSTLATPDVCGKYTTKGAFTPWSAPESGGPTETEDSFTIDKGVGGSLACPATKAQRPFNLGFEAGSTNPVAGAHSPFTLRITRPDGNQELDRISVLTPPGFLATLAGVGTCSEAQVAAALAPGRDGKTELASPSCPVSSQVGTTSIGAGVGSQPYYVNTGKIYRTGPYKGAQQSLTFIVPVVAGPFDLGVQVVRTALRVNPVTAQITAESDPIPQILEGIPVQIRDVRVNLDRSNFTLNPTNCEAMAISGQVTGGSGAVANVSNRFQVDNCAALAFKPKLKITYKGATRRGGNPGLRALLTQPAGQANIAKTQVILPKGSFIDNAHINNPCTRAQYAANACPRKSILGTAKAWSPLLDQPLSGNVYFRSNGGERELPDIVAALKGEVDVELVGFVDSVLNKKTESSRVRNTFAMVPDAPVSKFELRMKGGKVGLIENSKNLCKGKNKATVRMTAHNGRAFKSKPKVATDCKKKKNSKQGKNRK